MNELEIVNTAMNVVNTSKGIITQFRQYGIVQRYQLQVLSDNLAAAKYQARMKNRMLLTEDMLNAMERVANKVNSFPQNSPLFRLGMRELDQLTADLEHIIQEYMRH